MNRTIIISTLPSDPKGKCTVSISDNNQIIHVVDWVNYGIAITNIMQEWDCTQMRYTPRAKRKFLGKWSCTSSSLLV